MGENNNLSVNSIVEGKVSGITKFGAFVDLPSGETGMVHISEVSGDFVNDINDFLKIGDNVKVKVVSVEGTKIALSIKQAADDYIPKKPSEPKQRKPYKPAPKVTRPTDDDWNSDFKSGPASFEEMMSSFKKRSEDKMSDLKRSSGESRGYSRRGHGSKK